MPSQPANPRRRGLARVLALVALSAAFLLAAPAVPGVAAPANTSAGATFGLGPANAKGLDGRPYLTYLSAPGATITDHVAVVNLDTKRVTLNLYAVDATVTADGRFGYLARNAARQDASSWISLRAPGRGTTITIAPRATAVVPVSIRIPTDAEPGDHAAGVITSLTSKVTDDQGKQIDFEQRVALRTFFRISGPLHPALAIQQLRVRYHPSLNPLSGGDATVTYTVRNLGNVRLGARQKVAVSGLLGARHPDKALPDVPLLLPGTAVRVSTTVHGVLPQVRLKAQVVLYPLTVAGDVDPDLPAHFSASTSLWAVPWALTALIGALLFLTVSWLVWRRRRLRRGPSGGGGRHHRRGPLPDGPDQDTGTAVVAASDPAPALLP